MAAINGTNFLLIINGDVVGHSTSCTLSISHDLPDATTKDSGGWAESISGLRSGEVSCDGLTDYSEEINFSYFCEKIITREEVSFVFEAYGNEYTSSGFITSAEEVADMEAAVSYTANITINGAITLSSISRIFQERVEADGGSVESLTCIENNVSPAYYYVPSGYKAGTAYGVLPNSANADFSSFARSSAGSRVDKNGLIVDVEANVPRLDYTGGGCPSLLLEPQSTNYIEYSHDFSHSYWSDGGQIRTYGYLSPEGEYNASLIQKGSSLYMASEPTFFLEEGQVYTTSVYLKAKTPTTIVLKFQGESLPEPIIYASLEATLTSEWQRYEFTGVKETDDDGMFVIDDINEGEEFYVYGAQIEPLNYASSRISTSGFFETRAADDAGSTGDLSGVINSTEGTFMVEMQTGNTSANEFISLHDGTPDNRISVFGNSSGEIGAVVEVNNNTPIYFAAGIQDKTIMNKVAVRWNTTQIQLYVNGVGGDIVSIDAFSANVLNVLSLSASAGGSVFYGRVRPIRIYDKYESVAEMVKLTTL